MKKQDLIDKIIEIVSYNATDVNESIIDFKLDQLITDDVINFAHSCEKLCECEVPIIRTGKNNKEYCSLCGYDIK